MNEVVRLDGVDVALTPDGIVALFSEKKRQFEELRGRFDAMSLELEKEKTSKAILEDPNVIKDKVQSRLKLLEQSRRILGDESGLEDKSDAELKLSVINKFYPDAKLPESDESYIEGMFSAICGMQASRNDSLTSTRQALSQQTKSLANGAYEKWVEHSAKLWSVPLTGSLRG